MTVDDKMIVRLALISGLVLALFCRTALAIDDTKNIVQVEQAIQKIASMYGPSRTLVVFDIDNTLLTTNHDLGGDAWYRWQRHLQKTDPSSPKLISKQFQSLLESQYLLFQLNDMKPVETATPALVNALIARGHPVVALTARGPEARSATLRELKDAGYRFSTAIACNMPLCWRRGIISSDQVTTAANAAAALFPGLPKLLDPEPRPISYANGVMMVAGQNKGAMLQLLLASSYHRDYQAIVFIDDAQRNVDNVEEAFASGMQHIKILKYEYMEKDVDDFQSNTARQDLAVKKWQKLRILMCTSFNRFCEFN